MQAIPTIHHVVPKHFEDQGVEESRYLNQLVQTEWLLLFVHFRVIDNTANRKTKQSLNLRAKNSSPKRLGCGGPNKD